MVGCITGTFRQEEDPMEDKLSVLVNRYVRGNDIEARDQILTLCNGPKQGVKAFWKGFTQSRKQESGRFNLLKEAIQQDEGP